MQRLLQKMTTMTLVNLLRTITTKKPICVEVQIRSKFLGKIAMKMLIRTRVIMRIPYFRLKRPQCVLQQTPLNRHPKNDDVIG